MKNPFVAMALAAAAMLRWTSLIRMHNQGFASASPGHNRHSRHTVAQDKRAAVKARNVKRNKA